MRWIGFVGALVFGLSAIAGFTPKHRRRSAALGAPPWQPVALLVGAAGYAASAFVDSWWPMLVGVSVVFATGLVARRRAGGREIPPGLRRCLDVSVNPLRVVRHPIAFVRATLRAMVPGRGSGREAEAWFAERGL